MSALWPTGSTTQPRLSDGYGPRSGIPGARNFHYGVDIPMEYGAGVKIAMPGRVIFSGSNGSLGEQVVVQCDNNLQFLYPHMKLGTRVGYGAQVGQGQDAGLVGLTGLTTGPHSCFRVFEGSWTRDADARDPEQIMARLNGGAPASTVLLGIFRKEGDENMKFALEEETGGVYGLDIEHLVHFTTMGEAQYSANFFTAEDKIERMNTEQFQAVLRAAAIPFEHPERLRKTDPGGSWTRGRENANLLGRLVAKLGA